MELRYHGRSEKGKRDNNEDAFFAGKIGDWWLFAVADGLGGHQAGEQASAMALAILKNEVSKGIGEPKDTMELIAYRIHDLLLAEAATDRKFYGMATTLIAALVAESDAVTVMNIGDSRAYLIRNNRIIHTRDQNMVGELLASGQITEEQALNHPLRTIVDQALGDPERDVKPVFYENVLRDGWLILTSDGFHDFVRKGTVMEIVGAGGTPKAICRKLIEEASSAGSDDNITVVVVKGSG